MHLTLENIKEMKAKNNNPLIDRVLDYVIEEWDCYYDKTRIFTDTLFYGCKTSVSFLKKNSGTIAFYKKYQNEIHEVLHEIMKITHLNSPQLLFGSSWDDTDPLALNDCNQTLLAWFGFQETLRNIGHQFEELKKSI